MQIDQQHALSHLRFIYLVTLLFISACGGGSDNIVSNPVNTPNSSPTEYKLEELDFMDTELRRLHPDLFFNKSQSIYQADLIALKDASASMSDSQFRLEMAKFVAEIGDQHTYVSMPIQLMDKFPFKIWWEGDRAIVIEASQEYQVLLGQELISIDGTPLWEIRDIAMRYLAYENSAWKDALSPQFIHLADVLLNEGITSSVEMASFVFESENAEQTQIDISSEQTIDSWVRIEDLAGIQPLYRLSQDHYFYTFHAGLLYIQYNAARNMAGYPLSQFISDLEFAIAQNPVSKIIVDVRFNYGGIIDHFVPVVNFLAETEFNQTDSLFVLTGRNSFSSAVGAIYSFKNMTNASFVGGPTGGKPNGFSHVIGYQLNGSLNALYMATDYLRVTNDEVDSFYPQHTALFSQQDFIQGRDPAIEFILQNWP